MRLTKHVTILSFIMKSLFTSIVLLVCLASCSNKKRIKVEVGDTFTINLCADVVRNNEIRWLNQDSNAIIEWIKTDVSSGKFNRLNCCCGLSTLTFQAIKTGNQILTLAQCQIGTYKSDTSSIVIDTSFNFIIVVTQ